MTRYKLTVEYLGTEFYGWQRQNDLPTIQSAIEEAVLGFCQQEVTVQCAGRTDAGVHAWGQVAHVDMDLSARDMDMHEVAKAINAHLRPQPITILNIEEVDEDFHARFSASNKLYRYRIINRPGFLTLDKDRAWLIKKPLDIAAMNAAAKVLLGEHDFSTFRDSECQSKSPVKTLDRLEVIRVSDEEIHIEAEAQSFLHHMVRNLVGTLSLVGEGKWSADDVKTALEAKDRTKGGPTAPADGLYLVKIDYQ